MYFWDYSKSEVPRCLSLEKMNFLSSINDEKPVAQVGLLNKLAEAVQAVLEEV